MRYYWLLEINAIDGGDVNAALAEELGAIHVSTNVLGGSHIRRYIKMISEEEATALTLMVGDRVSIWPVSEEERKELISRGYINSQ